MKMNTYHIVGMITIILGSFIIIYGLVKDTKESLNKGLVFNWKGNEYEIPKENLKPPKDFAESIFTKQTGNYYHFQDEPNAYRPYKVTVQDEHCVVLTADNDTIMLYLENATRLAEEEIIYIFPNTP